MDPIRAGHSLSPIAESEVCSVPTETTLKPASEATAPHASASSSEGKVFQPEVGDQVLVAFERGDPRSPFVTGGLWNSQAPPTDAGNATVPESDRFEEERAKLLNHQLKKLK
ncbi:MAG TPA: phage baseplate assembly protein V [Terriglobales bacterium]|nr:phage baseplate assembly protein V [Terriglobales bacterium]